MKMPQYEGPYEKVRAIKIKSIVRSAGGQKRRDLWCLIPTDNVYEIAVVSGSYMDKHAPQVGGYYVEYLNGHVSYIPEDSFELKYTRLDTPTPDTVNVAMDSSELVRNLQTMLHGGALAATAKLAQHTPVEVFHATVDTPSLVWSFKTPFTAPPAVTPWEATEPTSVVCPSDITFDAGVVTVSWTSPRAGAVVMVGVVDKPQPDRFNRQLVAANAFLLKLLDTLFGGSENQTNRVSIAIIADTASRFQEILQEVRAAGILVQATWVGPTQSAARLRGRTRLLVIEDCSAVRSAETLHTLQLSLQTARSANGMSDLSALWLVTGQTP